jgi:multicomponent Na+:H+ antiporter subunit A
MPIALVVAVASGASMAGVPPLLGFAAKEAAIEAAITSKAAGAWLVGGLIILGSVLTVAYTVRLLLGLFGPAPRSSAPSPTAIATSTPKPAGPALWGPSLALAALSLAGYAVMEVTNGLVGPATESIDPGASAYDLYRWPGLTTAFAVSVAVVAAGTITGWLLAGPRLPLPRPLGAEAVDQLIDGTVVVARRITGRVQHGSLPVYMATMGLTAAVVTVPFALAVDLDVLYLWDRPAQMVLAVLVVASALVAATLNTRLAAALGLGAVGIAVSGLFVVHGAPDLALTQLLVETVVVVGFVVGLGHLTRRYPRYGQQWQTVRLAVATAAAVGVAVALTAAASAPTGRPAIGALTEQAVDVGGGNNVVNVILTDIRALDTLGEIVVLAVVAVGIVALSTTRRPDRAGQPTADPT